MCKTAAVQGAVYLTTGLWPVFHYKSFAAVTGPKTDVWLVRTVGLLLGVTGYALLEASRREPAREIRQTGAGFALALAAVDVVYASRGTIRKVYLADAALELAFAAGWLRSCFRATEFHTASGKAAKASENE